MTGIKEQQNETESETRQTVFVSDGERAIFRKDYDSLIDANNQKNFDRVVMLLTEMKANFILKNFDTVPFDNALENVSDLDDFYCNELHELLKKDNASELLIDALKGVDNSHYYHYLDKDSVKIDDNAFFDLVDQAVIQPMFNIFLNYGIDLTKYNYDENTPFFISEKAKNIAYFGKTEIDFSNQIQ